MNRSMIAVLCVAAMVLAAASSAVGLEITGINVGTWARLSDPANEDVRYVEALAGENVLFWRGASNVLRRASYSYAGGVVTLGTPTSPTGLTSGDHASILNNGNGQLEGYFHATPSPSATYQFHAQSADGGLTWTDETQVTYPFPSPPGVGDSGTTGGGGLLEVGSQRRHYVQNNFGDIALWTTSAGTFGSLSAAGRLIVKNASGTASSGASYSFQNQSPSGDAIQLPTGEVLYFYTDGEGTESTQGAVGVLLLDSTGLSFSDVRDNFVQVADAGLAAAGMTALDEMTVSNIAFNGNQMNFLLFLAGKHGGSDRDLFWAPASIMFSQAEAVPEPGMLALLVAGALTMLLAAAIRRRRGR